MPTENDPPTLFNSLARRRKEWLAQGALVHALLTEPGVRSLVAQEVQKQIDPVEVPEVWEEDAETASGWRADVAVQWREDRKPSRIELKLGAALSDLQKSAIQRGEMAILVVPTGREGDAMSRLAEIEGAQSRLLTWGGIAGKVADVTLRQLLLDADSVVWRVRSSISLDTAGDEMEAFNGEQRQPKTVEAFLMAVDQELDLRSDSYRSSSDWSRRRTTNKWHWYGYDFEWSGSKWWLGFGNDEDEDDDLQFGVHLDGDLDTWQALAPENQSWDRSRATTHVLDSLNASR